MTIHKAVFEVEIEGDSEIRCRALGIAAHLQFALEAEQLNKVAEELKNGVKITSVTLQSYE